jgi:glycosyltransferase involved in cell wall biosynthesis
MGMPSVSIIIPTFNRPQLLPRAVESARAPGTDVEIIVVDDASQDETAAVCSQLVGIKYIRLERNQGVAGARNLEILASTAEFVAFLDDDDLRLPGSLDLQITKLAADDRVGFVCGAMLIADQNYRPTGEVSSPPTGAQDAFWQLLELDFPLMPLSVVIRKQCMAPLFGKHVRPPFLSSVARAARSPTGSGNKKSLRFGTSGSCGHAAPVMKKECV